MIAGIQIYTSMHLTVPKNIARSPSRALRRWRRGIRKVTPFANVPAPHALRMPNGAMVIHPAMLDLLRREFNALTGIPNLPAQAIDVDFSI